MTSGGTILLVGDDPNEIWSIRNAFEQSCPGVHISVVSNGLDAVKYLKGQQPYAERMVFPLPNLVLVELLMPAMTGFQVLRWIREQTHLDGLPVVALANSRWDVESELACQMGADLYLVKPCDSDELTQAMVQVANRWLRHRKWFAAEETFESEAQREAA